MYGHNSPLRLLRLIYHIPNIIRLLWRLLKDPRVPVYKKFLPVTAGIICLLYIIFPFDVLPDPYPVLGQFDDITIILLLMVPSIWIFIRSCPKDIVKEHASRINQ